MPRPPLVPPGPPPGRRAPARSSPVARRAAGPAVPPAGAVAAGALGVLGTKGPVSACALPGGSTCQPPDKRCAQHLCLSLVFFP